ncbi:MAG: TPM domain-containing protein [Granulosicoccus sp.]
MAFLTDEEKAALSARINHAESQTSGEIVTVIARQSDGYRYIPTLWAAISALSVPGLYYLWQRLNSDGWLTAVETANAMQWVYALQVLVFLGLGMIFQIPSVRMLVVPNSVKRRRAARHAREQFFLQNLHKTRDRTGLLIFVSVAEHYVEIIVDRGLSETVDNAIWDDVVAKFIKNVQRGKIAAGFETAIDRCRDILWEHFPAAEGKPDELPNHLIEV